MTFKQNAIKRTVTGTFQKPNGEPSEGTIRVRFMNPVQGREENVIYTGQEVPIELVDGGFSEELAVTAPGLTNAEQSELESIIEDKDSILSQIASVQEDINVYLQKLQVGDEVTQEETDTYNDNIDIKRDLQLDQIALVAEEKVLTDKRDRLENNPVVMQVWTDFINPKERKKMRFVIRPGEGPIDLADIPMED